MRGDQVDVGLRLLDHQLIDRHEVRCGKIDDIALERDGGEFVVSALLSGPRTQRRRLPRWAARATALIGRNTEHRVEWTHVKAIEAAVELDGDAAEFGLGAGDRNAADLIPKWIPRS